MIIISLFCSQEMGMKAIACLPCLSYFLSQEYQQDTTYLKLCTFPLSWVGDMDVLSDLRPAEFLFVKWVSE